MVTFGPECAETRPAGQRLVRRWMCGAIALASALASPALADCASDFALGKRTLAPFDKELAERVPNTVILERAARPDSKLTAEQRPLATLAGVLSVWFHHKSQQDMLRQLVGTRDTLQVAKALETIGAQKQAGVLREAIGKFGKRYPSIDKRPELLGPYHGPPTELGKAVLALAPSFGTRAEFVEALAAHVCARPALVAWLDGARAKADEADNLAWLAQELLASRHIDGPPEKVAAQLAELPEPYRMLYLVRYADFEVANGGMHTLFSNSSGNIVEHMPEALRRIGLEKHAELVERGLAMFPKPYPSDRAERLRIAFGTTDPRTGKPKKAEEPEETWGDFDEELSGLTKQGWSYDAIEPAALAYARREGVVPK